MQSEDICPLCVCVSVCDVMTCVSLCYCSHCVDVCVCSSRAHTGSFLALPLTLLKRFTPAGHLTTSSWLWNK